MNWTDPNRWQVWSCGLGTQSAAIAALICDGTLPKPDYAVAVDTERERSSSWRYANDVLTPNLRAAGVELVIVPKSRYTDTDLFAGSEGDTCLLPAFTTQAGKLGKMPEFCSDKWKREIVTRWVTEVVPDSHGRGVSCWLGISTDEARRRRGPRRQWFSPAYPLLDGPRALSRSACIEVVRRAGWPEPPRSCCWMCPNMHDREWIEMRATDPADFDRACQLQRDVQAVDPHVWLHKSCRPLELVEFKADAPDLFSGGCSSGMCY